MGRTAPDGPYDGVPDHMRSHVINWFYDVTGLVRGTESDTAMRTIAMQLRLAVPPSATSHGVGQELASEAAVDEDFCLDLMDITLNFWGMGRNAEMLEVILRASGSVWKVASDGRSLELVVDEAMQQTYEITSLT